MLKNGRKFLVFGLLLLLVGCIIVKEKVTDEEFTHEFTILEKPSIPIGDETIRSENGDMIAFLPYGWFFVDTEDKVPTSIFAIAANPDYSLLIIFSRLTNKIDVIGTIKTEGLLGIAKKSFEFKYIKSVNNIRLIGNFEPIKNGTQKFYVYKYENLTNRLIGKSAIFVTPLNEVYEYSLLQVDVTQKQNISESEFDKIFLSVLSTIRF